MGVTFATRCVKCNKDAPELGDFGMMGLPSASTKRRSGAGAIQNFGHIYQGFASVQLVDLEMDQYLAFLLKHRGHPLEQLGEEEEEDDRPTIVKPWNREDEPPAPPTGSRHYANASYGVSCDRCGTAFASSATYHLRRFEPIILEPKQVQTFLRQASGDDDVYRAGPLSPDDLLGLTGFLEDHQTHRPRAVLLADAEAKAALSSGAAAAAQDAKGKARRFELVDGTSNKFWRVVVSGTTMTVRFGRIGTAGQQKAKKWSTQATAADEADKLIAEKLRKGYKEVPDRA